MNKSSTSSEIQTPEEKDYTNGPGYLNLKETLRVRNISFTDNVEEGSGYTNLAKTLGLITMKGIENG